jgi:hypothetical protein
MKKQLQKGELNYFRSYSKSVAKVELEKRREKMRSRKQMKRRTFLRDAAFSATRE